MSDIKKNLTDIKIGRKTRGIRAKYSGSYTPDEFLNKIAKELSSGAEIVELSDENMPDGLLLDTAKKIKQLCEMFDSTFIIQNRGDIAYLSSADGVNLKQESIDIRSIREIVGKDLIIGLYINSREDLLKSVKDGADYVIINNIATTPTEPVTSTGLEYAKWVSENTSIPVLVCGELSTAQIKQLKVVGTTRFLLDTPY